MSEGDRRAAADPRLLARSASRRRGTSGSGSHRSSGPSTSRRTTSSPTRSSGSSSTRCGTCPSGRSSTPSVMRAWERGYVAVNEAFADAIVAQARGDRRPRIMLHDYHLYLAAEPIRRARPGAILSHFTHIPWPPSSIWQAIAPPIRERDRQRASRQRRRRLPDRSLRPQLPAHGRVVRARSDGRLRRFQAAVRPSTHDARADVPDQHRRRGHAPDRRDRAPPAAAPTSCWAARASRSSSASTGSSRRRTSCAASSPTRRSSSASRAFAAGSASWPSSSRRARRLREYGHYGREVQNAVDRINARFGRGGLAPDPAVLRERLRPGAGRASRSPMSCSSTRWSTA